MNREQQQSQLKQLIATGKEQGFLTYAQVNDHLPNDIVDPEQVEDIIGMINDMGIEVHEVAPDLDSLIPDTTVITDDDEAAEVAAAALASVDSEYGRTTDPVRMYMREMGTVELLSREGELEIAIRIEEGLNQVVFGLARSSKVIDHFIGSFERVEKGELRLTDLVTDFIDPDQSDEIADPKAADAEAEGDEVRETGPALEEAREKIFALRKRHKTAQNALKKYG